MKPEQRERRDYLRAAFGRRSFYWPLLPFAGGLGLVAWVLSRQPMPVLVGALLLTGAALWVIGLHRLSDTQRAAFRRRVVVGLQAGALATVVYDLSRFGLVSLVAWSVRPWAAIPLFGELFIGSGHATVTLFAVGLAYHLVLNGIGFGVAYLLIVKRPHPLTGVLWAFGLEAAMALLYPRFLIIKQYGEFLTMSVVGHVCYGLVLGWWGRRRLVPAG